MNRKADNRVNIEKPRVWLVIVWAALVLSPLTYFSMSKEYIKFEDHIRLPIEHKFRDFLNRSPKIDKRLKIIGLDDGIFIYMKNRVHLYNSEWFSIFEYISKQNPAAIAYDGNLGLDLDFQKSPKKLHSAGKNPELIPLHIGAAPSTASATFDLSKKLLNEAWPMKDCDRVKNFDCEFYKDKNLLSELKSHYDKVVSKGGGLKALKQPFEGWHPVIDGMGHIYWGLKNAGRVSPVYYEYEKLAPYPYLGLSGFGKWRVNDTSLYVNENKVPVDNYGYMQVNYLSQESLLSPQSSISALALKRAMQRGEKFDFIQEGDYVLIVPYMYTGNPDMIWTPYGEIPGGLVVASVANSALTGQFINSFGNKTVMVYAAAILAGFSSLFTPLGVSILLLFAIPAALILVSLLLFAFVSVSIPWLYPLFAFLLIYIPYLNYRFVLKERSVRSLKIMFKGMVDDTKLKEITENIQSMEITPREKVVTVMFVDIEGFSLLVENMVPRSAFRELKSLMSVLVKTVHEHGGIVDKTLGDGLLAYFGHDLTGKPYKGNHAIEAINCAIDLQVRNTKIISDKGNKGKFYPLRIGVNTSTVFLGNLGNEERIDYTLVGNGVNFAKRLEGACNSNEILVSSSSHNLLSGSELLKDYFIEKKEINIKHHVVKVEAYNINPFERDEKLYSALKEISRERILLNRESIRVSVTDPGRVVVTVQDGKAEIKNFSRTGVSLVVFNSSMYEGKLLEFNYDSADGSLGTKLVEMGIGSLNGHVQWTYEENGKYIVGLKYEDLDNLKAQRLFEILTEIVH